LPLCISQLGILFILLSNDLTSQNSKRA
jgi:hypothetical protein